MFVWSLLVSKVPGCGAYLVYLLFLVAFGSGAFG